MRKISVWSGVFLLVFFLWPVVSSPVSAVESGGKVEVLGSGVFPDGGGFESEITESLHLELFLPRMGNNEARFEFVITRPLQDLCSGHEAAYFTKKLYLKHRSDYFHLTLGRQPVSWSFGSLLNPVDFTLGAEALDEESNSKYTDALRVYIPVNWNSGLDLVLSFPGGFTAEAERMKWGVRGRMGIRGYDLTINYVREAVAPGREAADDPVCAVTSLLPRQRMGLTMKGEMGDLGVYGALGYYFDDGINSSMSYLAGADYSYNLNYNTKVTVQMEYLGVEPDSLEPAEKVNLLKMGSADRRLDLLVGRISYPVDDFSSVSLVTMANLDDGSLLLGPSYQNTLPGNIDLTISGAAFLGKADSLFAPGGLLPRAVVSLGMSYAF